MSGRSAGARADRDLDAMMALFHTAERFVDQLPGSGPELLNQQAQLCHVDIATYTLETRCSLRSLRSDVVIQNGAIPAGFC